MTMTRLQKEILILRDIRAALDTAVTHTVLARRRELINLPIEDELAANQSMSIIMLQEEVDRLNKD